MPELSDARQAQRLRIYISEGDRWRGTPLYQALLQVLRANRAAGATVFRGLAGYGAHSHIHAASLEVLAMDLPIIIDVVDTPEKIAAIVEVVAPMVQEGLLTLEDVQVIKYTHRFLNPLPAEKLVAEVMTREVVALNPDMTVAQAWQQMLQHAVKALPVVAAARQVVGIVTDEDLLERAGVPARLSVARRLDAAEVQQALHELTVLPLTVADVMTHPVITVRDTDSLGAATTRMVKAGLKRLPVVDAQGGLTGMLSRLDVLRQVAHSPHAVPPAAETSGPAAGLTVGEIMSANVPMVNENADLATLVEAFAVAGTNRLVVVNAAGAASGVISDADVVARIQPEKRPTLLQALRRLGAPPASSQTAREFMSPGPLTCPAGWSILAGLQAMLADSRKWLVVVDETGRPVGVVDRERMLAALAGQASQK
jgi:CBS-domain-containing membrane protein